MLRKLKAAAAGESAGEGGGGAGRRASAARKPSVSSVAQPPSVDGDVDDSDDSDGSTPRLLTEMAKAPRPIPLKGHMYSTVLQRTALQMWLCRTAPRCTAPVLSCDVMPGVALVYSALLYTLARLRCGVLVFGLL